MHSRAAAASKAALVETPNRAAHFKHQKWPEAFAATEHGVARRVDQPLRGAASHLTVENLAEAGIDTCGGVSQFDGKRRHGLTSRLNSLEKSLNMAIVSGYGQRLIRAPYLIRGDKQSMDRSDDNY